VVVLNYFLISLGDAGGTSMETREVGPRTLLLWPIEVNEIVGRESEVLTVYFNRRTQREDHAHCVGPAII
jgi:hypothetical protein